MQQFLALFLMRGRPPMRQKDTAALISNTPQWWCNEMDGRYVSAQRENPLSVCVCALDSIFTAAAEKLSDGVFGLHEVKRWDSVGAAAAALLD
jgi:hypothetical protein